MSDVCLHVPFWEVMLTLNHSERQNELLLGSWLFCRNNSYSIFYCIERKVETKLLV